MERNKIRKIYFSIVVASAVLITGLSIACSNENDALDLQLLEKQSEQKTVLNKETTEFKSSLTSVLKQERKRGLDNASEFSEGTIKFLKDKGLKMFESHGFTEKDIRNVGAKTDEDIIFMAAIFTAIVEHPANTPRVMKKGESGGGCYNANKIVDCILQATGIQAVVTGCLTKAAALQVAKKYIPYVGYAVALADFANCMGWTDW
ncbi:hypothetical protein [Paraprevotella clara]|jgi:lipoprotein|uniref:hypothetical protein n=1 Tax=Paraprevotella clara TaxID=454154 RepID=UPI00307B126F